MSDADPSGSSSPSTRPAARGWLEHLKAVGPAIVVAAVVLGPGSILTSSKVGAQFGTQMLWVLASAGILMIGSTLLSAHLGSTTRDTLCGEMARRIGRPVAVLIGVVLFLVVAGFQTSNNLAVLAGLDPLWPTRTVEVEPEEATTTEAATAEATGKRVEQVVPPAVRYGVEVALLVVLNVIVVAVLLLARSIYTQIERIMKFCVLLMIAAFLVNLIAASPSVLSILSGLVPSVPKTLQTQFFPKRVGTELVDPWLPLQGMIATTFSIAGAFYQAYLVRERGWTEADVRTGRVDSVVGIGALVLASSMILITSATVLHGNVDPGKLTSPGQVAQQLGPLFGSGAVILFSIGIFAGALSSFLVNAIIGGTLLSDGCGFGSSLSERGPRYGTIAALVIAMIIAVINHTSKNTVNAIIVAQALTVLGGPVLSGTLLYLGHVNEKRTPWWMLALAWIGFAVTILLSIRTAIRVFA